MPVVGLRQLSRETSSVIDQLQSDGEPVIVTRQGRPIAALTAVSEEQAASFALALAPEFVASRERAAAAIAAGEGQPASELLAEFEAEDDEQKSDGRSVEATVPQSVVERVAEVAVGDIPASASLAPAILTLNTELIGILMEELVGSIVERVRTVNENIIALAGEDPGDVSVERYASELRRVTAAERLAARPLEQAAPVPVSSD